MAQAWALILAAKTLSPSPTTNLSDTNILMHTNDTNRDTNIRMHTNNTNKKEKLIYPELSYLITGICFAVHNQLGRFAREKQYCDSMEARLKELKIFYEREYTVKDTGNRVDFLIDNKIILEIKTKKFITKEDYYQIQRYLQVLNIRLGLLVNFRSRYLKPLRIIRIDTDIRNKFI